MKGLDFRVLVHLSTPYLNKSIKKALAHHTRILKKSLSNKSATVKICKEEQPFGQDVKMVRRHKLKCKLLTPAEQDEVVAKYEDGLSMMAIANIYGCHYTTVGRLLRKKGVKIRK